MATVKMSTLDLVRELRLRQWARQHFLPAEARKPTWHPVVLDEMCRRDLEISKEKVSNETLTATQQPFAIIDQTSDTIPATPMLNDRYQNDWGSMFVPLAPTFETEYHPATVEISSPHATSTKSHPKNSSHTSYLSESA